MCCHAQNALHRRASSNSTRVTTSRETHPLHAFHNPVAQTPSSTALPALEGTFILPSERVVDNNNPAAVRACHGPLTSRRHCTSAARGAPYLNPNSSKDRLGFSPLVQEGSIERYLSYHHTWRAPRHQSVSSLFLFLFLFLFSTSTSKEKKEKGNGKRKYYYY